MIIGTSNVKVLKYCNQEPGITVTKVQDYRLNLGEGKTVEAWMIYTENPCSERLRKKGFRGKFYLLPTNRVKT
jgi:hypothetical protein